MLLLDTCVAIWLSTEQERLSAVVRAAIARSAGSLYVSGITAFEFGLLRSTGRVSSALDAEEWFSLLLENHGLHEIPVSGAIAARSTALPAIHKDPADRMIVATAVIRGLPIATPDGTIPKYPGVTTVW